MAKCAASTSASLGVRLGGMQLFNELLTEFTFKDKYYGRGLDENEFIKALLKFFNNGVRLRKCVIDQVICKLRELRASIEKQTCFRFFSTSLLIAYEGCTSKECELCEQHQLTFRKPSSLNSCFLINECTPKDERVRKKSSTTNRLLNSLPASNPTGQEPKQQQLANNEELDEALAMDDDSAEGSKLSDDDLDEDDCSSMDTDDYYHAIERANKISNEEFMKSCEASQLMVTTTIKTNKNKKRKRRHNSFSADEEDSSMDSHTDCLTDCNANNYEPNNNTISALNDQNSSKVLSNKLLTAPAFLAAAHQSSESSESCSSSSDLSEHQPLTNPADQTLVSRMSNQIGSQIGSQISNQISDKIINQLNKEKALNRKKSNSNNSLKRIAKTKFKQLNVSNASANSVKLQANEKLSQTDEKTATNFVPKVKPNVDVRIIDFAHTVHKDEDKDHDGPDVGFLFGLDSLIKLLVNAKDNDYEESRL